MNCAPVERDATADRAVIGRDWVLPQVFYALGLHVLTGGRVIATTVELHDVGLLGLAESLRRLGDGVEHGLDIRGGTGDNVKDFADRGLIFERLLYLSRASLHLLEQPYVLDGDHRLVSEGRYQLDLLVCKRLHNRSGDDDHPYRTSLSQERNAKNCSVAAKLAGL